MSNVYVVNNTQNAQTSGTKDADGINMQITYPHKMACQITQVADIPVLIRLHRTMQEEHEKLSDTNRRQILQKVLPRTVDLKDKDLKTLNEPTLEALYVFNQITPLQGHAYFSTATANSWNDPAPLAALKLLKQDNNYPTSTITSTVDSNTAKTAVSGKKPKHIPINFNKNAPLQEWSTVGNNIYNQFLNHSTPQEYDVMFHWSCISQNWQFGPHKTPVSSWQFHEQWNFVMTVAMMRHTLQKLRKGGQVFLKVRIFQLAESLGILSLFALAFKKFKLIINPRQTSTFVTFVGSDFLGREETEKIAATLKTCADYNPVNIFCNDLSRSQKFKDAMSICKQAKDSMVLKRCKIDTAFLYVLRLLADSIETDVTIDSVPLKMYLTKIYPEKTNFVDSLIKQVKSIKLARDKKAVFLQIMKSKWMQDNC